MLQKAKQALLAFAILTVLVCISVIEMLPYYRHAKGPLRQVEGVVESSGMTESGNNLLDGRTRVVVVVKLADGRVVSFYAPGSRPVRVGARVRVDVQLESFGPPAYRIVWIDGQDDP